MLLPYIIPFTGEMAVARNFSSVNFVEGTIEIEHNNTRVWHLSAQSDPLNEEQIHITYLVGPIDLSVSSISSDPATVPIFELYFISYNLNDEEITVQERVATDVFPFEYELHVVQGGELDGSFYISYIRLNEELSPEVSTYSPSVEIAWSQNGEAWQTRQVGSIGYTQNGTLIITEDEQGISRLTDVTEAESLVVFTDRRLSAPDSFVSESGTAYITWSSRRSSDFASVSSTFISETNLLEENIEFKILDVQGNDFGNNFGNGSVTTENIEYGVSSITPLPNNEVLVSVAYINIVGRRTAIAVHKISLDGLADEANESALSEKSLLGRWQTIATTRQTQVIRAPLIITDEGYNILYSATGIEGVSLYHLPTSSTDDYSAEWSRVRLEEKLSITLDHVHGIAEEDGSISSTWSTYTRLVQPFNSFGFISNYDERNEIPVTGTFVNESRGIYRTSFTLFRASEVSNATTGLIWIETTEPESRQYETILKYDRTLQERVVQGNSVWAFLVAITICTGVAVAVIIVIRMRT